MAMKKKMPKDGTHMMPGGKMMSDREMEAMMGGYAKPKKKAKKKR